MTFILETGAGTPGANAYTTPEFGNVYLQDRARELQNGWTTQSTLRKQRSIIVGTMYLDRRFGHLLKGWKLQTALPGRQAFGTVTFTGQPADGETLTLGAKTYTFRTVLVLTGPENEIRIGTALVDTLRNIVAVVNSGSVGRVDGLQVATTLTQGNFELLALVDEDEVTLHVWARAEGVNGNGIVLATTVTGATPTAATLLGGLDGGPQPLEFPREGLYDRYWSAVTGVPLPVREATMEYAVRSLVASLDPDPSWHASGVGIQRKLERVGPIWEETQFVAGSVVQLMRPYPEADLKLASYLKAPGVYR
jgi:hypothetical protein